MAKRTIKTNLIKRQEMFRYLALAECLKIPLVFDGPPGIAKTQAVTDYVNAMKEAEGKPIRFFKKELTGDTKVTELLGHVDHEEFFTNQKFRKVRPIADADVIFINEVDKGSSVIKNSLLSVMNEKEVMDGDEVTPCSWRLYVGACNDISNDKEEAAFWDRFILKFSQDRLQPSDIKQYYKEGGRSREEVIEIEVPTMEEIENVLIDSQKFTIFLDEVYQYASDRTLTFSQLLVKAFMLVWEEPLESALAKVAKFICGKEGDTVAKRILDKVQSDEVKELQQDIYQLFFKNPSDKETLKAEAKRISEKIAKYRDDGRLSAYDSESLKKAIFNRLQNSK